MDDHGRRIRDVELTAAGTAKTLEAQGEDIAENAGTSSRLMWTLFGFALTVAGSLVTYVVTQVGT